VVSEVICKEHRVDNEVERDRVLNPTETAGSQDAGAEEDGP
jgi:hypothetical protein